MLKSIILNNYKSINVLKDTSNGTVEQVLGPDGKVYIRKTLPGVFLPCKELMSINNPYIVNALQAASDEKGSYVIEEYAEGRSLAEFLEAGKSFSEKEVINIALQLCEALICLQKHKLVHRDIKPGNILLHSSGAVKLIDFGACRSFSDNEEKVRDTVVIGTTSYAAPEQFGGKPTDHRADIYSLAITMKELLGESYYGKLSGIIAKCLEFDPNKRPKNAEELRKLLMSAKKDIARWIKFMVTAASVLAVAAGVFLYYRQQVVVLPENNIAVTTEPVKKSRPEENKKVEPIQAVKPKTGEQDKIIESPQVKDEAKTIVKNVPSTDIQEPKATIKSSIVVSKEEVKKVVKRSPAKELDTKSAIDSKKSLTIDQKKASSMKKSVKIDMEPKNWFFTYEPMEIEANNLPKAKPIRIADYAHQPEVILFTNKQELRNMRATYVFKDIKFLGNDLTVGPNSVGNIYSWQVFKDADGNSNKVVHRISGGIIDNIAPYFSLWLGNVGLWFLTGNKPSLTITVEADNADAVTMTIPIIIK